MSGIVVAPQKGSHMPAVAFGQKDRIVRWVNVVDARRVNIYPDRRVHSGGRGPDMTIYRSTVLAMTDDEWYARPHGDGWIEDKPPTRLR